MTVYMLYHGNIWKAESQSFNWLKSDAMRFHKSARAHDAFILPRKT